MKKNRGFTFVELAVVLMILAILAAFLVPTLLGYIDKTKNANPRYTFGSGKVTGGGVKPSNYFGEDSKPTDVIIQIFHTDKGKMAALNFAKDGYMVTMIEGKETTCVYDGNCLPSWE